MRIGCVLILYNPDLDLLSNVLFSVEKQVDFICIVDNSLNSIETSFFDKFENLHYIPLNKNVGIATAQNVGLNYFLKIDYSHVFFLDQDSITSNGLVEQLMSDLVYLETNKIHVGGIGPMPVNRQDNKNYRLGTKTTNYASWIVEVSELMNSGAFIPLSNFKYVGLMDDSLFIDGVDHEWCWRAKYLMKLRFFVSDKVSLDHQLGEGDRFFLYRKIAVPTPFRCYYQFRNYFILIRRNYIPLKWKFNNGIKYVIKLFYYPIFISPRFSYLKQIVRGIFAGIRCNK